MQTDGNSSFLLHKKFQEFIQVHDPFRRAFASEEKRGHALFALCQQYVNEFTIRILPLCRSDALQATKRNDMITEELGNKPNAVQTLSCGQARKKVVENEE